MARVDLHELEPGIVEAVLNRPDKHNGIDWAMLNAWRDTARAIQQDRSIRAVILRGEGPSFCSGLDFGSFTKQPMRLAQGFVPMGRTNLFQQACMAWRDLSVPVLAVLHGRCYGGGIQLALAADFRFATPDCELSILEAKWGLIPDMGGTVTLRELVGIDQAKLLTYTGRKITGEQAASLGLVTEALDDPMAHAVSIAQEIASRSPDSVAVGKKLLQANWTASERAALARERRQQFLLMLGANFKESVKANFEKRAPSFVPRSWLS